MASKTKKTELQRTRRDKRMGRKRKNKEAKNGTSQSPKVLFQD